jgi:hypothetical protein
VEIGTPPWTHDEMRAALEEFAALYTRRPIRDNAGGMRTPHLFGAWFVLRKLQPAAIVESGVWRGQGTWFFEQACPQAELHCVDVNLTRLEYRSTRAHYHQGDFNTLDWRSLPPAETLLFFDDHQDAYERLKTVAWFGFKHCMFEDNYAPGTGDCYSLKAVLAGSGFAFYPASLKARARQRIAEAARLPLPWSAPRPPNSPDAAYLRRHVDVYCELPPVVRPSVDRGGNPWDHRRFPTPEPLLESCEADYQRVFFDEAAHYVWLCYVRLK